MTQGYNRYPQRRRPVVTNGSNVGVILAFAAALVLLLVGANKAGLIKMGGGHAATGSAVGGRKAAGGASKDGAAILAEAKKHDNEAYVYGGGHPPGGYRNGAGLDCSGLIDVAVLRVTGINENVVAAGFQSNGHWNSISAKDAKAGDIMYLLRTNHPGHTDDHVVIVVTNGGNGHLTVFEAYGSQGVAFQNQIRQTSGHNYGEYDGVLRFHR